METGATVARAPFYFGSKEAGKQTNVYEKGHQLFGEKDATSWQRIELRYGNKFRELNTDLLRRPADGFAGAGDWHASMLREAEKDKTFLPIAVPCDPRLPVQTIEAEVTRNKRWVHDVAGPSFALTLLCMDLDEFEAFAKNAKLPGRLRRFSMEEIKRVYSSARDRIFNKAASAGHAFAQA